MSVYIKGMEMPECCEDCIFYTSKRMARCTLLGNVISSFDDDRLSDCPIVEVSTPPEELKKAIDEAVAENAELRHRVEMLEHDIKAQTGGKYIDLTKVTATG